MVTIWSTSAPNTSGGAAFKTVMIAITGEHDAFAEAAYQKDATVLEQVEHQQTKKSSLLTLATAKGVVTASLQ